MICDQLIWIAKAVGRLHAVGDFMHLYMTHKHSHFFIMWFTIYFEPIVSKYSRDIFSIIIIFQKIILEWFLDHVNIFLISVVGHTSLNHLLFYFRGKSILSACITLMMTIWMTRLVLERKEMSNATLCTWQKKKMLRFPGVNSLDWEF